MWERGSLCCIAPSSCAGLGGMGQGWELLFSPFSPPPLLIAGGDGREAMLAKRARQQGKGAGSGGMDTGWGPLMFPPPLQLPGPAGKCRQDAGIQSRGFAASVLGYPMGDDSLVLDCSR